jgi:ATP-dependent RNA helicase DHX29
MVQVLMSATMQSAKLSEYFSRCPILHVGGRSFPVRIHFLDESVNIIREARGNSNKWVIQYESLIAEADANQKQVSKSSAGNADIETTLFPVANDKATEIEILPHCNVEFLSEFIISLMLMCNNNRFAFDSARTCGQCILVFLPGIFAIESVRRALTTQIASTSSLDPKLIQVSLSMYRLVINLL